MWCFVVKMKITKDTLLQPSAKVSMKTSDCLTSIHVPVEREIVQNMTLSQNHNAESSVTNSSSEVEVDRLVEVDSNAVSAMLWTSDSMLRQSLLSPALLSFTYPGHDKPVKDIDLEIKGVSSCNSELVSDLSLSAPETEKSTICPSTATQGLRTPLLNSNSSSESSFYTPDNSNQVIPKKCKHSSDHPVSDKDLPLPPIAALTSNHMLTAVNGLNLQRLQRNISTKQKSEHGTDISHNRGSPSSSCAFSSHNECSPLSQQHHVTQAMLPSDLILVASDTSDIHRDHLPNHSENLAEHSPSNSGLLSHLPSREACLPAISGSQVSSVLSALAEGVSVDSTSTSEDVDMEREDRPPPTHLCVSVAPQICSESIPVFTQIKESSNSSQCSEPTKIRVGVTEEILNPIKQSPSSDSLSLGIKCEPAVLLGQVPIDSTGHSINGNSPEIGISNFLQTSSNHNRQSLKDIKSENAGFSVSSKFSDSKVIGDECYSSKKKLPVDQKKCSGKLVKNPASTLNSSKLNRPKKNCGNLSKNSPIHHLNQNQNLMINNSRSQADNNFVEEIFCFKCNVCNFLSFEKVEVVNHIEESHSSDLLYKSCDSFADSTSDHAAPRDWSDHLKRRRLKCPGCPNVFFSSKALEVHLSLDHQVNNAELQIILKNMNIESTQSSPVKSSLKEESMSINGVDVETKPSYSKDQQATEAAGTTKRKSTGRKTGKDCKLGKDYNETLLEAYMDEEGKLCIKEVDNFSSDDGVDSEEERTTSSLGLFNVEATLDVSDEDYEDGKVCSDSEKDFDKDVNQTVVGTGQQVVTKGRTPKRRGRPRGSRNSGVTALRRLNPSVQLGEEELGYLCGIDGCAVRLRSIDNIEYHRRCHVPGGPAENGGMQYVCPECGELFSHWGSVGVHLWRVHEIDMELYSCDQCSYKTNSYSKLMNLHKRIHSNERSFLCDACGKGFKTSKQLRNHKTIHIVKLKQRIMHCGECEVCHRSFSDRRMLRLHRDTVHHKLRPYLCNFCGYSASSRSTLKMHMRQHTGEKPFQCDACEYRTADHNTLRRHKMRHSGEKPYKCPYCPYACIQSSTYKTHLKNKHPGQDDGLMFSCNLCSFRSIKKENYVTHMADHEHGAIPANNKVTKKPHHMNGEANGRSSTPGPSKSKKKNEKSFNKKISPNAINKAINPPHKVEFEKKSELVNVDRRLSDVCNHDSDNSGLPVESGLDPLRSQGLDDGPIILSVHSGTSLEDSKDIILPVRSPQLTHSNDTLSDPHQNHFIYSSSLDGILHQMPHFPSVMTVASWQTYLPEHSRNSEDNPDEKEGDVSLEAESPLSSNGDTLHSSQLHAPQSILFSNNGTRGISANLTSSYRLSTSSSSPSSSSCSEGLHFTQQQQMMKLSLGQIQQGSVIRVVDQLCSSPSPVVNADADTLSSNDLLRSQNHVENINMDHMSMTQDDENSSDQIREDVLVAADDCDDEEELKYKVTKDLRDMR